MMKLASSIAVLAAFCCGIAHGQLKFSQSSFPNVVTQGNSIACLNGGLPTDNSYIRFYNPFGEGETTPTITITDIRYGVESATAAGAPTSQPIFINVFSAPTGSTSFSSFTLLHQEMVMQPDVSNGGIFTQSLSSPVAHANNANTNLVIELFAPSGVANGNTFFMGSNALGQSQPCFIAAAACSFPNPVSLGGIAPNMHIILDVCYSNQPLTYPGTSATQGDDLECLYDVGLTGTYTTVSPSSQHINVNPGQTVEVAWFSPSGSLAGVGQYFAVGSIVTTGTVLPDVAPNANIYVGGIVFLFDGLRDIFGFPVRLPLAGSATNFGVPPGLTGTDVILQGYVLGTAAANNIYASSNGFTITFN